MVNKFPHVESALDSDGFPERFDPSRCILFLGAGFSADSKNMMNVKPPVGDALNKALKKLAEIPEDELSDFTDTANYVIAQKLDLFSLLEGLYTIRELTYEQRKVLALPWLRIYTTNYDNSVSVYRAEKNIDVHKNLYDLTDNPPRQLPSGSVIHLHGSIAKCDPARIDDSLVLSRRSYVEQRVKKSPWWDWFDRDIKISQYTFFLGYDINDFEPASYLIRYPEMQHKRHFILRSPRSPIVASKVLEYGIRHSFELGGFVARLSRAKVEPTPAHENQLTSFRYVDLSKDKKLYSKPTSAEIQELLAFGRVRFDSMRATLPESDYVVFRAGSINSCRSILKDCTTLVIHSKIGNGKTILSNELKIVLSQDGWSCFELRENLPPLPQDINFIKGINAAAIFFPNYDSAVANIHLFEGMPEKTRYVVEMSSSTLQVRMQEVHNKLKGKVGRLDLDRLDQGDVLSLRNLLKKAGLTSLSITPAIREGIEFRDFLLMSYDEPEIAKRLQSVIIPVLQNSEVRRLICISSILKTAGLAVDIGFIEDVAGEEPYVTLNNVGENILELMEYSIDKLEPHSSVLSEHILRKYIGAKDITDAIFSLAAEAAVRMNEVYDFTSERFRRSRALLSAVIRYGFIESIIDNAAEKRKIIGKLYESCRRDSLIEKEPLFWLQYSIFWQDESRWDLAESHMIEAYARGETRPGFKTFQLDTNYLGLLCDLELHTSLGQPVTRLEKFLELVDTCRTMIDDGNHRNHVTKTFLKVEPMLEKRNGDLMSEQRERLRQNLILVIAKLSSLSMTEKALWGTEPCRLSLENCVRILASAPDEKTQTK